MQLHKVYYEHFVMQPERKILLEKLIYLRDKCLDQRGNCNCVINAGGNIADAKLQRWEEWMWAHIPIDLLKITGVR
jgi:hypothetical protein